MTQVSETIHSFHPSLLKLMRYGINNCIFCGSPLYISKFESLTCYSCPYELEIYANHQGVYDYIDFYLQPFDNTQVSVSCVADCTKMQFLLSEKMLRVPFELINLDKMDDLVNKIRKYLIFL